MSRINVSKLEVTMGKSSAVMTTPHPPPLRGKTQGSFKVSNLNLDVKLSRLIDFIYMPK